MIQRVLATESALALIARLQARHGELMFYQSHGCCDGSTPMLFPKGEMTLNSTDIQMGEVGGVPFHVSEMQFDYLSGSQITLDVEAGSVGTFSLEDGEGVHFVARSRLWTDDEWRQLSGQANAQA